MLTNEQKVCYNKFRNRADGSLVLYIFGSKGKKSFPEKWFPMYEKIKTGAFLFPAGIRTPKR